MGQKNPRQRKVTRTNRKQKRLAKNPLKVTFNNPIIQKNWDKKLTVLQNYEKLGLITRVNGIAGGNNNINKQVALENEMGREIEKIKNAITWVDAESLGIVTEETLETVIQDDEIFKELEPLKRPIDPSCLLIGHKVNLSFNANLSAKQNSSKDDNKTGNIIKELEQEARNKKTIIRHVSHNEQQVLKCLIQKYEDDWERMARDRKLNPFQLTAGQLKKKACYLLAFK